RLGTILDLVTDVAAVLWLMGSAQGGEELLGEIHGARLEHLLERLVDTPVRGFVYEAAGTVPEPLLRAGREAVGAAARTWRIPVAVVEQGPDDREAWLKAALEATGGLFPAAGKSI
ncbi:MAG TPA: hypothetical protein VG518_03465, partial [Solirubrobacterales bacterium]|nr:hypothetical protein [Solirubrobacterales bacterium]